MKLAFFNKFKLGAVKDGRVVDISSAVERLGAPTPQALLEEVITRFDKLAPRFERLVKRERGVPLQRVRLRSPVPKPTLLVCAIRNYKEFGQAEITPIDMFLKSPMSIIGSGDTVELPEAKAEVFHHEAELAFVVKRTAKRVRWEEAMDYVFGYIAFIDVSARGLSRFFFNHKSYDTFAPMGPTLVTADEIPDPNNLDVKLWVSGQLRQNYNTNDMAHNVAELIEFASHITTLSPGDVIACGTNHQQLGPMQDGDLVEIEIERIGKMGVKVTDPLKRMWPRTIDEATAKRILQPRS